ncbi:MAG: hypothetical protein J6S26_04425 [Solobacterium sp.]|nr:hypothetical protein [Solobacterium sp.]
MRMIEGIGWKACYDEEQNLYTAGTSGPGAYDLYEIDEEIFKALEANDISSEDACRLIYKNGRHLYMDVDDRCGPPYTIVLDEDYQKLCPWAKVRNSGPVWSEELTDAAVELFASEEKNREQRRKKREARSAKKKPETE